MPSYGTVSELVTSPITSYCCCSLLGARAQLWQQPLSRERHERDPDILKERGQICPIYVCVCVHALVSLCVDTGCHHPLLPRYLSF